MGLLRAALRRSTVTADDSSLVIGSPASPIPWEDIFGTALSSGIDPSWLLYGRIPKGLALSHPVVRKGLLTFDLLGGCPLTRWRGEDRIDPGALLEQPEDWCPYSVTMAATIRDLVFYPYAWWLVVEREWTGYPKRVQRLDPEYVQVQTVPGAEGMPAQTFATFMGSSVPTADLIRFDGPDLGFLHHGAATVITALRLEQAADRAASPEVPDGVITSTGEYQLTDPEIEKLMDGWKAARAVRRTAFLNNAQYVPIVWDPQKMQLIESRETAALQLCRMLGLPPRYCAVSQHRDSMTYTTVVEERRDLIDISFGPYVAAIEQRLSMDDRNGSPRGQSIRFDYSALLRGSPADRTARAQALVPLGVMSRAEARIGEPDLTGPPPPDPGPPGPPPTATPDTVPVPPAATEAT